MNDFERVCDAIPFAEYAARYVQIKAKKALCIFHADAHASMHIYQDGFKCFSCNTAGNIFDFAMKLHGWTQQEALMELAREANVQLTPLLPHNKDKHEHRERLYACLHDAMIMFNQDLFFREGKEARDYLTYKRGIEHDTKTAFMMGYARAESESQLIYLKRLGYSERELIDCGLFGLSDNKFLYARFRNRITIPMFDHKGRVVGFSGRDMGEKGPKYLNSPESELFHKGKILYSISSDKGPRNDALTNQVKVIVEGHMDVISAYNRGFKNVYAQMGSTLSSEQLNLLCRNGVERLIFCLDNDSAGQAATERLVKEHAHAAADKGVDLYVMINPHGKDPDDTFREKPELWQAAVDTARPAIDVLIEMSIGALPQHATSGDKQRLALKLLPLLKGSNAILQETSFQALAAALALPVDVLRQWASHQPDLRVIKTAHPVLSQAIAPIDEHWILSYILTFEDENYVGQANQTLCEASMSFSYEWGVKCFAGLMPADFINSDCKQLMVLIHTARERNDMIHASVKQAVEGGPLQEIYERVIRVDEWARLLGISLLISREVFLDMIIGLRMARLERDSLPYKQADPQTWMMYQAALMALQEKREAVLS